MDDFDYLLACLAIAALAILLVLHRCAYHSGVADGYGAAVEPENPGYRRAQLYLQQYMADRWPELLPQKRRTLHELLATHEWVGPGNLAATTTAPTDWDVARTVLERQQEVLECTGVAYRFLGVTGEEQE